MLTLLFLLCLLLCTVPLQRMADAPLLASLPTSRLLALPGSWLPTHLFGSKQVTGNGEFLLLIVLMFGIYGVLSRIVRAVRVIIIGAMVGCLLFVFTPALPSHDVFIYADYGRSIVAHSANPYFVPSLFVSPHDPITLLDSWNSVPAAYGPLWLAICSFFALFLGDDPVRYVFAFRLLGLVAHIANTLLVTGILRAMGRSQRTVILGALLYGYNPLALMESCLGPHNDACMVMLMLAGIWFALRTTRLSVPKGYVLPVVMMSLAVLIKFTSIPLLLLFLVLLARKTLSERDVHASSLMVRWRSVVMNVVFAGIVSLLTILLFYCPFWVGHSISEIMRSFLSPPSSNLSENSLLRVLIEWSKLHRSLPRTYVLRYPFYILVQHLTWTIVNVVTLIGMLLIGCVLIWRTPTMRNVAFGTLLTLEAILVVTPWFYSWYVLWIVGLAIVLLGSGRVARPLVVFALTFSVTAFFTYLDPYYLVWAAPNGDWLAPRFTLMLVPPLLIFFALLLFNRFGRKEPATQGDELPRESVPSR